MKRIMRLFASVGLMTVLLPAFTLAEFVETEEYETELTPSSTLHEVVVEYKGARVGFSSERDIIFDIPPSMTCEDLTRLMNSFYSRYLEPEENRPFTLAERRLLLLCIYTNLCDMSALWTGLLKVYNCEDPTRYNNCPDIDMLTGYLVDRDKFYLIRNRFEMEQYAKTEAYQRYVGGMTWAIYGCWTDAETGKSVLTGEDLAILKKILEAAAWNKMIDLRYLEKDYDQEAMVWHLYRKDMKVEDDWRVIILMSTLAQSSPLFLSSPLDDIGDFVHLVKSYDRETMVGDTYRWIMGGDDFRRTWLELRRYYKGLLKRCEAQKATLERQSSQEFEDVATEDVTKTFALEWVGLLEECRVRLHRCVYDAPYCLLITKASSDVACTMLNTEASSVWGVPMRWFARDDRSIQHAQEIALLVNRQITDIEDVTEELSTEINSAQTKRFLQLLKMAMGDESYAAFRESTKLIKCLEKVGDGYTL